jgi:hypothetical protein
MSLPDAPMEGHSLVGIGGHCGGDFGQGTSWADDSTTQQAWPTAHWKCSRETPWAQRTGLVKLSPLFLLLLSVGHLLILSDHMTLDAHGRTTPADLCGPELLTCCLS